MLEQEFLHQVQLFVSCADLNAWIFIFKNCILALIIG